MYVIPCMNITSNPRIQNEKQTIMTGQQGIQDYLPDGLLEIDGLNTPPPAAIAAPAPFPQEAPLIVVPGPVLNAALVELGPLDALDEPQHGEHQGPPAAPGPLAAPGAPPVEAVLGAPPAAPGVSHDYLSRHEDFGGPN